jgi:hypothetical protein
VQPRPRTVAPKVAPPLTKAVALIGSQCFSMAPMWPWATDPKDERVRKRFYGRAPDGNAVIQFPAQDGSSRRMQPLVTRRRDVRRTGLDTIARLGAPPPKMKLVFLLVSAACVGEKAV